MDTKKYEVLEKTVELSSLTKAAQELGLTQSGVSHMLAAIEAELQLPLLKRTRAGARLTPEGERLYAHVRIAFEHIEAGEAELTEARNLQTGTVYIAASEVALRCLLLPVLKQYRLLYPGVHIRISNHSTPQAIAALKDGAADIAAVTTPTVRSASLVETVIRPIQEVAVCSSAFPALTDRPVALSELLDYPIISLGPDTKSFAFYSDFFTGHGLPFHPAIEAFTADQILPMVEADLGVGFVPNEFLESESRVCRIDLKEQIPERQVVLIKRKGQPLSVAARKLEHMILDEKSGA